MVFFAGVGDAGFAVVALGLSTTGSATAVPFSGSFLASAVAAVVAVSAVVLSEVSVVVFSVVVVVFVVVTSFVVVATVGVAETLSLEVAETDINLYLYKI